MKKLPNYKSKKMYWEDIIMDYGKIKEAAQGYEEADKVFMIWLDL